MEHWYIEWGGIGDDMWWAMEGRREVAEWSSGSWYREEKKSECKPEGQSVEKLRDEPSRLLFECRFKRAMSDNSDDLSGSVKEGALKACDEVCGQKKNRKSNVSTWSWKSG